MKLFFLTLSLLFVFAVPVVAIHAQTQPLIYTPLEPIVPGSETGNITLPGLLNTVFRVLMSVGALIAVVSLTVAGIEVMVSEIPVVKNKARERAWAAIWVWCSSLLLI